MHKIPPVVIQFLAIISCKHVKIPWSKKKSQICRVQVFFLLILGNILTFSFGLSNFWATINLLELTSENSTFPTGPLTQQEFSLIISIGNIGSLLGNFLILPISQTIGVKYSIHLLGWEIWNKLTLKTNANETNLVLCLLNINLLYGPPANRCNACKITWTSNLSAPMIVS